jgi:MFS family permease
MDSSTDQSLAARSAAPALPKQIGAGRLLSLMAPTALALYANFQGVQLILVPLQVEAIDPNRKIVNLAAMTFHCALTGVLGLMIGGAASDATRGRWGRRSPWLATMAAASTVLSLTLGLQARLIAVAAAYGALWFTLNFFQSALLAVAPDRVPERLRSFASSVIALAGPVGTLLGVNLAAFAPNEWGYAGLAAILAVSTTSFLVFAREGPHGEGPGSASPSIFAGLRPSAALTFFHGFRSRDFSLAFAIRTAMFTAQFMIANYLFYILQDHIGVDQLPARSPQIAAGALTTIRTLATILAIFVAGWLANRSKRRKPFVQVYALGMAIAMLIPVFSPTWLGMTGFAVIGGLAMGAYSVVDLALMSQVLPNKSAVGRDLAILVMAGAFAQFISPVAGGALIKFVGYDPLFACAAILTTSVAAMTFFLRGVR